MKKIINYLFLSAFVCAHTIYPLQRSLNYLKHTGSAAAQKVKKIYPVTFIQVTSSLYLAWFEAFLVKDILDHEPTLENSIIAPIAYLVTDHMLQTPINIYVDYLIKKNKPEIVESLLQNNLIDLNGKKNMMGPLMFWESPLHVACQHQRPQIVRRLLSAGSDTRSKDESNHTAYDYVEVKATDTIQPHDTEEIVKQKQERVEKKLAIQKLLNFYVAQEKLVAQLEAIQQKQQSTDLVEIIIEKTSSMPEYCAKEDISSIIASYLPLESEENGQ